MTISTRPPRWFAIRRTIPFALLLVGTVLAIGAARYAVSTGEARLSAAFLGDAAKARHDVEARLNSHFDVVRATGALLTANSEISGADFRAFVSALELHRQYPGLKGIGFAPRVSAQNANTFRQLAELDGTKIWPQSQEPDLRSSQLEPAKPRAQSPQSERRRGTRLPVNWTASARPKPRPTLPQE